MKLLESWLMLAAIPLMLAAQQTPVLKSTTRLVEVSVIAQDGKGEPVADLKKDDFRVNVDGKAQTLSVFSMESGGALPRGEASLPPNVFSNRMNVKSGQQSSVTIILLDMLNTDWADQVFAKAQVIRYLRTLQPGDHIGLYTLGASLRVLHDYTADSIELLRRLEVAKGSTDPADAAHGDSIVLDLMQRESAFASPAERAVYTIDRATGTLKAIKFIADHLAKTPGRKNLIWVSGGFPLQVGPVMGSLNNPQTIQRSFGGEITEAVRALSDANMAVYPVDARGLLVGGGGMATRPRSATANIRAQSAAPTMVGVENQFTMNELASRTGGRAYYNSNDLAQAIHSAVDDSRVTYMLGFYPVEESFDGKFHKIDVEMVERKGVHLRYRKGFLDLPELPQDEKSRRAQLAEASWSPMDAGGIGIAAKIVPSASKPGSLEIALGIDSTEVNLREQDQRWVGRLDVLFVQRDEAGNQYNALDDTVNLRLTAENYAKFLKNGFVYTKLVPRAEKANTIRIVVRDSTTGAIGSITAPVFTK